MLSTCSGDPVGLKDCMEKIVQLGSKPSQRIFDLVLRLLEFHFALTKKTDSDALVQVQKYIQLVQICKFSYNIEN